MNPFDYVKDINFEKRYLMNDDYAESEYSPYITNKSLALFPDTLFYANEMNLNSHLDKKLQHDYLFYSVRKKKRFEKWPWKKSVNDDIDLIMKYYKYNRQKAKQALSVLSREQLEMIKKQQEQKGGIE